MPDDNQEQQLPPSPPPPPPPKPLVEQVGLRVSLIPAEELKQNDPRTGFSRFLIIVIVFVFITGGICAYLAYTIYANNKAIAVLDAKTNDYIAQSKELAPTIADAKKAQSRLKALSTILVGHRTGLKVLKFFQDHTLNDVAYSSISVSENGSVSLAVSASSYETYAAQLGEFRAQKEVKSLTASGVSPTYDEKNQLTSVSFNITVVFNTSIFLVAEPTAENKPTSTGAVDLTNDSDK